jgi:hypothetical protein
MKKKQGKDYILTTTNDTGREEGHSHEGLGQNVDEIQRVGAIVVLNPRQTSVIIADATSCPECGSGYRIIMNKVKGRGWCRNEWHTVTPVDPPEKKSGE